MIGAYEQIDILEEERRSLALDIFKMEGNSERDRKLEEYVRTARRIQSIKTHLQS